MINAIKSLFLGLSCLMAASVFADTAIFENSDLDVSSGPKTKGAITLSVPASNGMTWSSNSLHAGGDKRPYGCRNEFLV